MSADASARWLETIAKALAAVCLQSDHLRGGSLGKKAEFLAGIGMHKDDIARMLGTTPETVRVTIAKLSQGKRKSNGKKPKNRR